MSDTNNIFQKLRSKADSGKPTRSDFLNSEAYLRGLLETNNLLQSHLKVATILVDLVGLCFTAETDLAKKAAQALEMSENSTLVRLALQGKPQFQALVEELARRKDFLKRYTPAYQLDATPPAIFQKLSNAMPSTYQIGLLILLALHTNRPELLFDLQAKLELIPPLVELTTDENTETAARALDFLQRLPAHPFNARLCWLALEAPTSPVGKMVLSRNMLPAEKRERALFFFLTQRWDNYVALDFDGSLLRELYFSQTLSDGLKRMILQVARQTGRTDLLHFLSNEHYLLSLSLEEWLIVAQTQATERNWLKLWELVQYAPPAVTIKILRTLGNTGWQPAKPEERQILAHFKTFAEKCAALDMIPFGWRLTRQQTRRFVPENLRLVEDTVLGSNGRTIALNLTTHLEVGNLEEQRPLTVIEPANLSPTTNAFDFTNVAKKQNYRINHVVLSEDCQWLAFSDKWEAHVGHITRELQYFYRVTVYNLAKGETLYLSYTQAESQAELTQLSNLVFSPDSKQLVANNGSKIFLWKLSQAINAPQILELNFIAATLHFTPDSHFLVCSSPFTLRLLNLSNGSQSLPTEIGLKRVSFLKFSTDNRYVLLADSAGDLEVLNFPELRRLGFDRQKSGRLVTAFFTSNNQRLVTLFKATLKIWQLPNLSLLSSEELELVPVAVAPFTDDDAGPLDGTWMGSIVASPAQWRELAQGHSTVYDLSGDIRATFDHEKQTLLVFVVPNSQNYYSDNCSYWTAPVTTLATTPLTARPVAALQQVEEFLQAGNLPVAEKTWLEFIQALLSYRARFAIELEVSQNPPAADDDIELDN